MNLENIIKDFEAEEEWLEKEMRESYGKYEQSEYTDESALARYSKLCSIDQRVSFIKSEMNSLLEIYRK